MAKIPRKNSRIFGSNADPNRIGVFGSLKNNNKSYSTDPEVVQGQPNWLGAWDQAVMGGNSPAIEDVNAVDFVLSHQTSYLLQSGIPAWHPAQDYYIGNIVNIPAVGFTTTSANATIGAVYTNNGKTFTVLATIAAGQYLVCQASGAPTATGTLTKTSGTGDATITFSVMSPFPQLYSSITDNNINNLVTDNNFWKVYHLLLPGAAAGQVLQLGSGGALAWQSPDFLANTAKTANIVIGQGDATNSATGGTIRGPARIGSNDLLGVDTIIDAGNGTGNQGSGSLIFRTAPASTTGSAPNTLTPAITILKNQRVGIGVSPTNTNGGVIQLSSGITFPVSQIDSTDLNTLDDYEEGSWTPAITSSGGGAAVVTTAVGRYVKIGRTVWVQASFAFDRGSLLAGVIQGIGLPFPTFATIGGCGMTCPNWNIGTPIFGITALFFLGNSNYYINRTTGAAASYGGPPLQLQQTDLLASGNTLQWSGYYSI